MSKEIIIQFLGNDPEREALLLSALCEQAQSDELVVQEFGSTVNAYTTLTLDDVSERIRNRYSGDKASTIGAVLLCDSQPAGMAFVGVMPYKIKGEGASSGINASMWLLERFRNQGLGTLFLDTVYKKALQLRDVAWSSFYGALTWTSIRNSNIPSQRLAKKFGFVLQGLDDQRDGYSIYQKI